MLILSLIVISTYVLVPPSATAQLPTYKLGVKAGNWATYEARDVTGGALLNFSDGDMVKLVVKDIYTVPVKHPDGSTAFYREASTCDMYVNGELKAQNNTFCSLLFWPTEDAFWNDFKSLADEWEAAAPPGVEAKWDVDIGTWYVDIYIYNKTTAGGLTAEFKLSIRIDKDTGVATRAEFHASAFIVTIGFTLVLKETDVPGVGIPFWPPFIPPPEEWGWAPDWLRDLVANYWWPYLAIGSVIVLILIIAGIIKLITRRRRPAYPYGYPYPPPRYPTPPPSS